MRLLSAADREFVDGGPAFLDGHAALGDIAERADIGIEFTAIGARQQAPRQCPPGLKAVSFRPGAVMQSAPSAYGKATTPSVFPT